MVKSIKGKRTPPRAIISITQILLSSYIILCGAAYFFSEKLIFPYKDSSYGPSLPGLIILKAKDGTPVAARYWKTPSAESLVILFHGNYEDLGHLDGIANTIMRAGFSVLAMDYRGYGLSKGTPTETNCYSDARMMLRQARALGYDETDIILWGRSVGSGPATQLAIESNPRALVLESPFTTAFRTMTRIPLLPFDKFNNLEKMDKVTSPLLILHGTNDAIIPSWHSSRLIDRHRHAKSLHFIEGAGHNNLWTKSLDPAFKKLTRLLDRYDSSPRRLPEAR